MSTTLTNSSGGGGGGGGDVPGWISYLGARQTGETAHALDKFFPGTDIAAATEVDITGTTTWTEAHGRVSVICNGSSNSDTNTMTWALTDVTAPAYIETRVRQWSRHEDNHMAGLCFTDGTTATDNIAAFRPFAGGNARGLGFAAGTLTNSIADASSAVFQPTLDTFISAREGFYIRLIWSAANTFKVQWSQDGVSWWSEGFTDRSFTFTPTRFGLAVANWGGANDMMASWDYIRVGASDPTA